jgi:thiamine thiazole synthase
MPIFESSGEKEVTRAIVDAFSKEFQEHIENDVIIVGGGPAGLIAAMDLAKHKVPTLIIERNNYLGGGFWIGGYLMNKTTVRAPSHKIFDEIGVPYTEASKGLYVANSYHACAKLISAACDAGAKVLSMTSIEDVIIREKNRVGGVVINWTPVKFLPREVRSLDPVSLEARLVIDATGHDATVLRFLEERGLLKVPGFGAMWVEKSEEQVVERTGEAYPGLLVAGMSVSAAYGLPRMGPTFGAMLLSGRKAAKIAYEKLKGTAKKGRK